MWNISLAEVLKAMDKKVGRRFSERIIDHSGRDESHTYMNMQKRLAMEMWT